MECRRGCHSRNGNAPQGNYGPLYTAPCCRDDGRPYIAFMTSEVIAFMTSAHPDYAGVPRVDFITEPSKSSGFLQALDQIFKELHAAYKVS